MEKHMNRKDVVVYFAAWHPNAANGRGQVGNIPWDRVTYVNHAFWVVEPADGSKESTFERRAAGLPPRTIFRVAPMFPEADLGPGKHFAQYAQLRRRYPQVKILLSIGGWTRSGYFSEMAYTREGRASFVRSCMDVLKTYPWVDGFDIDWEYFGGSAAGERLPGGEDDQGCALWGTSGEDCEHFAQLCRELRSAMEDAYGPGVKKLTACAGGSPTSNMPSQNWALSAPYLDLINIMTYDLAGPWDGVTGHANKIADIRQGIETMQELYSIAPEKICIGSPLYPKEFRMVQAPTGSAVGAECESVPPAYGLISREQLHSFEGEAVSGFETRWEDGRPVMGPRYARGGPGWHFAMEEPDLAPYLYNDDEASAYYRWFLSYENALSLQQKLDYIQKADLAGIIVWECSEDTADYGMIGQMARNLLR